MAVVDGMLPEETEDGLEGVDLTGFNDNYWIGLSLLHTLFVKEHNAICRPPRRRLPEWDDERLFLTARLVNAALMAKIHTVEWTPGILANPVLERAMNANWYGILPRFIRDRFGHLGTEMIGGIVGSNQEHGVAPYSITEEFVSVYRLHPLLPDDYEIRDHRNGELIEALDFDPIQGHGTRPTIEKYGWSNLLYTFGTANPGAITLHNHPRALSQPRAPQRRPRRPRDDRRPARPRARRAPLQRVPRGAAQAARRELRGPHRQPEWNEEIRDVYGGDIDRVDLQVGLLGEPLPTGFGFSDTAFRIFILMASRRLRSDRFFTNDYSPEVYTPEGIEWVEGNTMVDVLAPPPPGARSGPRGRRERVRPWQPVRVRLPAVARGALNSIPGVSIGPPEGELASASPTENVRFTLRRWSRTSPRASSGAGAARSAPRRGSTSTGARSGSSTACAEATATARSGCGSAPTGCCSCSRTADVRRVLEGSPSPFAADPEAKRKGMSHFQPDALTISREPVWEKRRRFAEAVLDTAGPQHRLAERFAVVCRDEVRTHASTRSTGVDGGELGWDAFSATFWRITRRVVLGDGARDDAELTEHALRS